MGQQFTLYSAEAYSESKIKLFQLLTIFAKGSVLDVCLGSEYASVQ